MKPYSLYRVAAISGIGMVLSGVLWLGGYAMNHKEGIGFDGPAGGILIMSIFDGWLLSSSYALQQYLKSSSSQKIVSAIITALSVGLIIGILMVYIIAKVGMNYFSDLEYLVRI